MITYDDVMVANASIMSATTMLTNQYNADRRDEIEYYPQWEGANQVFAVPNCFQNAAHG